MNKNYQKEKWTKKYVEYCNKLFHEKGDYAGYYCCGYHWCCYSCSQELCNGCADCVHTIKLLAKKFGIKINYLDYDFNAFEEKVRISYVENEYANE